MDTNETSLKQTPLFQRHKFLHAKIVGFSGWAMPVEYSGILTESIVARSRAVMFDASHMGQFEVSGPGALAFLERIASNNVSALVPGKVQYNLLLNESGGIIDDFMIYRDKERFLCVVNAANREKDFSWFRSHAKEGVILQDKSDEYALISVQGPRAAGLVRGCFDADISTLVYMHFIWADADGRRCLVSRTGYTGEDGFEIYVNPADAGYLWDLFLKRGTPAGLIPAGLGARDILRMEAGYPLHGNDITEETNPLEAALGWAVHFDKEEFIGKRALLAVTKEGIKRKRVGFIIRKRAIARHGYAVYDAGGGSLAGRVTSGTYSPNLEEPLGMAYVAPKYAGEGTEVMIKIRQRMYPARVHSFRFLKKGAAR